MKTRGFYLLGIGWLFISASQFFRDEPLFGLIAGTNSVIFWCTAKIIDAVNSK